MSDKLLSTAPGHIFMIGLPGKELDDSTRNFIQESGIHNFILFRRNIRDREQVKHLCEGLIHTCLENGLPHPIISIDQEGGQVARLPLPFTQFSDPRELAEDDNCKERLLDFSRICAQELLEVGVNMNLAPVLDVCPVGQGLFMERRCLGEDPQQVAELGGMLIAEMQKYGLAACGKHFPGLGTATLDPHHELPVVDRSLLELQECELIPFRQASALGVAAIMTSHAVYEQLDKNLPGTLSEKVVTGLLREECGYQGLIITDDLEMGAIENFMDFPQAALRSFVAGADLLLICHDHDKVKSAFEAVRVGVESGICSSARIAESYVRQRAVLSQVIKIS